MILITEFVGELWHLMWFFYCEFDLKLQIKLLILFLLVQAKYPKERHPKLSAYGFPQYFLKFSVCKNSHCKQCSNICKLISKFSKISRWELRVNFPSIHTNVISDSKIDLDSIHIGQSHWLIIHWKTFILLVNIKKGFTYSLTMSNCVC